MSHAAGHEGRVDRRCAAEVVDGDHAVISGRCEQRGAAVRRWLPVECHHPAGCWQSSLRLPRPLEVKQTEAHPAHSHELAACVDGDRSMVVRHGFVACAQRLAELDHAQMMARAPRCVREDRV